ncbi:MAG: DUF6920 family protein [Vulcanimicrobiaceae bacterium]
MQRRTQVVAGLLGGVAATTVATWALGAQRWKRETGESVARLRRSESRESEPAYSRDDLTGLPEPVVRYFQFALLPGQSRIRRAQLRHAGELRENAAAAWMRFTSVEHLSVRPPGFVWDANVDAPLFRLRVRDSYFDAGGASVAKLGGLITVAEIGPSPQLASASLARYLAESAWLPTALLPSKNLRWESLGERSARVMLRDGEQGASLDVEFGAGGEIERVSTLRYREAGGALVLTPWAGRLREYRRIAGMMVPMEGEVEWRPPEGAVTVWRGRLLRAGYEFA